MGVSQGSRQNQRTRKGVPEERDSSQACGLTGGDKRWTVRPSRDQEFPGPEGATEPDESHSLGEDQEELQLSAEEQAPV